MPFPTRRAGVALLAGCATLVVAAPADAAPTATFNTATGELAVSYSGTDAVTVAASGANVGSTASRRRSPQPASRRSR